MGAQRVAARVWAVVVLVGAAAAALVVTLPAPGFEQQAGLALLLAGIAVAAGARPVRLAALKTEVTVSHPFIFCALAVVGPQAAALTAVSGVLGAAAFSRQRVKTHHLLFNLGAVVASAALAHWAYVAAGGRVSAPALAAIPALAAATAVYFTVNTSIVAAVIAVEKRGRFLQIWRGTFLWTLVSFACGLTMAVGMIALLDAVGPWGLVLAIPPCGLLVAYHHSHKQRIAEHERRIAEVQQLNADLELRVAERTAELQGALRQIQELQALRETLSQTLVHDLKNPLTAIVGNLDLLERQTTERAGKLVKRSKNAASRLLQMILDLLDVARIEESQLHLDRKPVNLAELARSAAENAEPQASRQRVTIAIEADHHDLLQAHADPAILHRVLDNLLANAVQYSPAGGTIAVTIDRSDGRIEVAVADEGRGIPEELRHKVFDKFAQAELHSAGVSANRGLGLTFCKLAVDAHGGSIGVETAAGGGALFRLSLPAVAPKNLLRYPQTA